MTPGQVRRAPVWSVRLRGLHWLITLCVVALLLTGWLLSEGVLGARDHVVEIHLNVGYVFAVALALRVVLLVWGEGTETWRDLLPLRGWRGVGSMLLYYASLGRAPLPAYFGHNPLWGPIYLLFFLLALVQVASGILGLDSWHQQGALALAVIAVAHVVAVFLHDLGGTEAELSAMVNGYKYFTVRHPHPGPAVLDRVSATVAPPTPRSRDGRSENP